MSVLLYYMILYIKKRSDSTQVQNLPTPAEMLLKNLIPAKGDGCEVLGYVVVVVVRTKAIGSSSLFFFFFDGKDSDWISLWSVYGKSDPVVCQSVGSLL